MRWLLYSFGDELFNDSFIDVREPFDMQAALARLVLAEFRPQLILFI